MSNLELLDMLSHNKMYVYTFHCLTLTNALASRGIMTNFLYIPTHSCIVGYHQADKIAKKKRNPKYGPAKWETNPPLGYISLDIIRYPSD